MRIVKLLADGLKAHEIGPDVELTRRSYEAVITRVKEVYGCRTSAQLVAIFLRKGYIK